MSPEQSQHLEDLKAEIQAAAQALRHSDATECCNRLVDAFLMLTQYLEDLEELEDWK
jgi:hypothetical protein